MLLVVTVFAMWLGWELRFIRERQAFLVWRERVQAESRDHAVLTGPLAIPLAVYVPPEAAKIPIWRRWLGDQPVDSFFLPPNATVADQQRAKALFPEALLYTADGSVVSDN